MRTKWLTDTHNKSESVKCLSRHPGDSVALVLRTVITWCLSTPLSTLVCKLQCAKTPSFQHPFPYPRSLGPYTFLHKSVFPCLCDKLNSPSLRNLRPWSITPSNHTSKMTLPPLPLPNFSEGELPRGLCKPDPLNPPRKERTDLWPPHIHVTLLLATPNKKLRSVVSSLVSACHLLGTNMT